ncbi:class I SAM-dependent methyltransferase [Streptomyces sp. 15-116A]|uniref:class I SAM-dependent methyltransferase n=1 Tax=Streptomyces sp. 15-116A TaxID=2259035 RepID=UPI0021B265C7|nr:class I SAM-dependent methyltransferase [Streptomyces sp. 15-116A]MCT7352704.1 class I SAM-dependent methyltransferase [Streptomyces sp. 15-116A]
MTNLGRLYPLLDDVRLPDDLPYSQVSTWELRFLYLLGRHHLTGADRLVELGSGGGGSTYALALGLRESPVFDEGTGRLHAYDFFRVGKGTFATEKFFTAGAKPADDDSFLDDFKSRLEPFLPFLEIHAGDLWQTSDPQDTSPIEFLHVDIAKTARVFRCVAERFLTRLRPGSVVLHQDFAGPRLPWLHHSTGALLPYIEIAGPPIRSTLAFEVVRPIPEDLLKRIAEDAYTVEEKLELISAVQERIDRDHTGGIPFKSVLEFAKAYVAHYAGDHKRAWSIAEALTGDAYLSRTRADHFAQLRTAYEQDREKGGGGSRLGRLVRKAVRR